MFFSWQPFLVHNRKGWLLSNLRRERYITHTHSRHFTQLRTQDGTFRLEFDSHVPPYWYRRASTNDVAMCTNTHEMIRVQLRYVWRYTNGRTVKYYLARRRFCCLLFLLRALFIFPDSHRSFVLKIKWSQSFFSYIFSFRMPLQ